MTGAFGMGIPAAIALTVAALVVLAAVIMPAARRVLAALVRPVVRLPSLIRAELRGAAPLQTDRPGGFGPDGRVDTTPDIPVVTRGLPIVDRHGPAGGGAR